MRAPHLVVLALGGLGLTGTSTADAQSGDCIWFCPGGRQVAARCRVNYDPCGSGGSSGRGGKSSRGPVVDLGAQRLAALTARYKEGP